MKKNFWFSGGGIGGAQVSCVRKIAKEKLVGKLGLVWEVGWLFGFFGYFSLGLKTWFGKGFLAFLSFFVREEYNDYELDVMFCLLWLK